MLGDFEKCHVYRNRCELRAGRIPSDLGRLTDREIGFDSPAVPLDLVQQAIARSLNGELPLGLDPRPDPRRSPGVALQEFVSGSGFTEDGDR
ncbi:Hypothetical protein SMAX5B_015526 [Scophthalmus maximus]|uniref:Uncharacterized protein n=1 Tax=Scophthalmus maximus TaxID=52904 RepID=A0A2U9CYR7_SCOMX|nr:Hypothetical protein SMAX5B_015526 [Scophthalmus maximus]